MEKGKVLFIDTTHPVLPQMLKERGFEVHHFYQNDINKLKSIAADFTGFIIRSKFRLDEEILKYATQLKFIGRVGAGMENIDVNYTESVGIKCFNAPEGNRDAVAEQAIGMLLSLFNNLKKADIEVRKGIWKREENRGVELGGKTVGIIGYGNTGSAFARKLRGFDVKILAYDKYKKGFSNEFVTETSLEDLFENADIVSLHIPLTEETRFMVNHNFISSFKKNIYLINTSRGRILRTSDLIKNLDNAKVIGACLDVLEFEGLSFENLDNENLPTEFKQLIKKDNVILSPHIAGWTYESNVKLSEVLAKKILKFGIY